MSDFFQGVTFANQNVSPVDDAILRRRLLSDGVLTGCELTYAGYTLTMAAGYLIACGRQIRRPTAENWAISDATSGYARVLMTIDLTRTATEEVFDQVNTSIEYATAEDGFPALIQDDINATGSKYQVVLAIVSLGTGGITGIASCLAPARSYGSNYNLLDNSDFTNLVAQAGIGGNHGTIAYAADRWILDSGTVSYATGTGLTLNGTIHQKIEHQPAGQTSAFVGVASGEASISYADGAVTITSSGGVLKWAALYEGEYTAETLPEYQSKGYGAELAECQRYFLPDCIRYANGVVYGGRNYANILIPTPVKMRGFQINVRTNDWIIIKNTLYSPSSITGITTMYNGVIAQVNFTSTFAENTQCSIANVVADIIADL